MYRLYCEMCACIGVGTNVHIVDLNDQSIDLHEAEMVYQWSMSLILGDDVIFL